MLDLIEVLLQCFVGVDREVGGDNREPRAVLNLRLQEVGDGPASVIILDAGTERLGGCFRWNGFLFYSHG